MTVMLLPGHYYYAVLEVIFNSITTMAIKMITEKEFDKKLIVLG